MSNVLVFPLSRCSRLIERQRNDAEIFRSRKKYALREIVDEYTDRLEQAGAAPERIAVESAHLESHLFGKGDGNSDVKVSA